MITFSKGFTITPLSNTLYPFSAFTFTTAGVSGSTGPTLAQMLAAYTGSTSGSYFSNPTYFTTGSFPGYQVWTVPATATYEIEIAGSRSSIATYPSSASGSFAKGAIVRGRYTLSQGQKIAMVVGQYGPPPTGVSNSYNGLGGGGGSYFAISGSTTPILVAGGGGGGGAYSGDPLGGGIYRSGSNGTTSTTGSYSFRGASPGTGSYGGHSHYSGSTASVNSYDGGGGGGWLGNGWTGAGAVGTSAIAGSLTGGSGLSFLSGSTGGGASTSYTPTQATPGGFGGGGGGTPIAGGGGGGYSGGAGTYAPNNPVSDGAGGGGSFISASATNIATSDGNYEGISTFNGNSITNIGAFNSGAGYIKITRI
jgi:Glycine rich protein